MNKLSVIILAAGKGSRMQSAIPKVLHRLAGKPIIQHVIDAAKQLMTKNIYVVYGHGGESVKQQLQNQSLSFIEQKELLGTGHAVQQVLPYIDDDENILILYGDVPLISIETLYSLQQNQSQAGTVLLTAFLDDPTGYGRILRDINHQIIGIVEQKDANQQQLKINEINSGIMLIAAKNLKKWLKQIDNNNQQKEYYLTDIINLSHKEKELISAIQPSKNNEIAGINNRYQLTQLERIYQQEQTQKLAENGISFSDINRFDLRGTLTHGRDIFIDTNVILEGNVSLGNNIVIGSGCVLKNCHIADNCVLDPYCVIDGSTLDQFCTVGPFSRLRPGTHLANKTHVGNFVEIKNTYLGEGSKAGHLSYLGDSEIGYNVNIGAGSITCNYDGANKHKTIIGNNVFVGSDTQFVAPVIIADGATIGAGTTVTDNINQDELVISRVRQKHIIGWQRPQKKKK